MKKSQKKKLKKILKIVMAIIQTFAAIGTIIEFLKLHKGG